MSHEQPEHVNSTDEQTEQRLIDKGLNAPRLTPNLINDTIEGVKYINRDTHPELDLNTLTICVLILKNGQRVIGESACVSPENFKAEEGKTAAYRKAVDKIWELEAYALRERLFTN